MSHITTGVLDATDPAAFHLPPTKNQTLVSYLQKVLF